MSNFKMLSHKPNRLVNMMDLISSLVTIAITLPRSLSFDFVHFCVIFLQKYNTFFINQHFLLLLLNSKFDFIEIEKCWPKIKAIQAQ